LLEQQVTGAKAMPKFHVKHLLLAGLLGLAISPAFAQKMYRCPSAGGGTTFSDTPCANNVGSEISVKPASGTAAPQPKADPQTRGAIDKRNAEYNALLTPECRRAREAFLAKSQQKGGMDELMKEGNPISKVWEACEFEATDALGKQSAQDRERVAAEERKRAEQNRIAIKKNECATKQKVIDDRRARLSQLSEQDRAALRAVEQDVAINCR
jgi:Domain of unknown function (DUF4124)